MTLNEIFAIELKESTTHNGHNRLTPEEQRQIRDQYREACGIRSEFYRDLAGHIDSEEQSNAVYSSISDSDSIVQAVLKIRRMIKTGIVSCNDADRTKLDERTISVLEAGINDFDRDTKLMALGSNK